MAKFTREELEKKVAAGERLEAADLKGAHLRMADLSGAILVGADLTLANLRGTTYDKDTKFPEGFDLEAAGMVLEE